MSMSGWGTLTGESHYTLSSLAHSFDRERRMGSFNVLGYKNDTMDKLLQDAAIELDDAKRRKLLEDANALVDQDKQRLPIVAVSSAWAMDKTKVTLTPRVDETRSPWTSSRRAEMSNRRWACMAAAARSTAA